MYQNVVIAFVYFKSVVKIETMSASAEDNKYYELSASALRKATSDTEKFGALFVVSRVLKDKPLSSEQNIQLFKLIDPKFLSRLLLSDGTSCEVPEGCPQYIYQTIGLSIVSSFFIRISDHIDIKTSLHLLSLMIPILRQLNEKENYLDDNEKQMLLDIITCFQCFVNCSHIKDIDFQLINSLFETNFTEIFVEMRSKDHLTEYKSSVDDLLTKIAIIFEWSDFDDHSFDIFFSLIVNEFSSNKDQQKFDLCLNLNSILIKNQKYIEKRANSKSIELMTKTIFDILPNKLNKPLRDPVLQLASTLTQIFNGFKWIGEWNQSNCKHFLLLLRLVCIEIAVNYESENIDMNCVANSFVILEHCVVTVANDSETMHLLKHFSQQEIYDMLTAIKDTMTVIIRYLVRFKDEEEFDSQSELFASILASIRVLCVWTTEETEALREEIADILPFILKVFKISYNNRVSINKPIITALIAFSEDDRMKSILLNEDIKQFLNHIIFNEPNNELLKHLNDLLEK